MGLELIRLVAMVSPHTGQEEQVRNDLEALGKVLPMVQESVEMMEEVRDEVATMLQQTRQKERKEMEGKEKLMRAIEREIKSRG